MFAQRVVLLEKHERWLLLAIFLLFVAAAAPGVTWGAPSVWNPDELVYRVNYALQSHDYGFFDRNNFDYPSLPKYALYILGSIVYRLGGGTFVYIVASRLLSVALGGVVVVLTYLIARQAGATLPNRVFAALLTLFCSEIVANAHFGHNDPYLLLFVTSSVYLLLRYQASRGTHWLYGAFATAGLAASSKYNGIFIVLAPVLLFALDEKRRLYVDWRRTLRTYGIGGILTAAGYVLGTPRAVLSPVFYFRNMWPAFLHHRVYGQERRDSVLGVVGQWSVLRMAVGGPVFLVFMAALLWALYEIAVARAEPRRRKTLIALVVCVLAFNVPFWVSYNYQTRFFLPLVPLLSVLTALALQRLYEKAARGGAMLAGLTGLRVLLVAYSVLRTVGVDLLFLHDSRIAMLQFVASLPPEAKIGYGGRFGQGVGGGGRDFFTFGLDISAARQVGPFPDYWTLTLAPGDARPGPDPITSEAALVQRCATYYVVDSITTDSFEAPSSCRDYPDECGFLAGLRTGHSQYTLLRVFSYDLPAYLPSVSVSFVNPTMRVFFLPGDPQRDKGCESQQWRAGWRIEGHEGSTADIEYSETEPGHVRANITTLTGRVPWYVTLVDASFSVTANHHYELAFRSRADAPRRIVYAVGVNTSPWNTLGLYGDVDVTTDWRTFHLPFVATSTESNARVLFPLGESDAAVELADVVLHDASTGRDVPRN